MLESALLLFAAASAAPCEMASSTQSTVSEIAQEPDAFVGRCVRVVGYSDGRSLFGSSAALREHLRLKSMKQSGILLADEMIGVYDLPKLSDDLRQRQYDVGLKWQLTGKIDTCAEMQRRAQREADARETEGFVNYVMMTGHCHYLGGPVLLVTQGQVLAVSE